jgi:Ca2+-binding RTX toxin-like protein
MKTKLLIPLLMLAFAGVPAAAHAGNADFSGGDFYFEANPGESNYLTLSQTSSCAGLSAPCLSISDDPFYPIDPPAACRSQFAGIVCPLPGTAYLDMGDEIDFVYDWEGPSVIDGGTEGDALYGRGGNDVIYGGAGIDVVIGGPGDDAIGGGPDNDYLEAGFDSFAIRASDTAGSDYIEGGDGGDTLSYEGRSDALNLSEDGQANDGAAGENDEIAGDVEIIKGGSGDDVLTGGGSTKQLWGLAGNDTISGSANDETLVGGADDDVVAGQGGNDTVKGGVGDDLVDGGAGSDYIYGEDASTCGGDVCVSDADEIHARDGEHDVVDCGDGIDVAQLDSIDTLPIPFDCEGKDVSGAGAGGGPGAGGGKGGAGSAAAVCGKLPGKSKAVCTKLSKAVAKCGRLKGSRKQKTCVKRAVRRATRSCRAMPKRGQRAGCLRSVKQVARQRSTRE